MISTVEPRAEIAAVGARICRHCHRRKANRHRGLCWSCYNAPGVRETYPSTSKFARRGVGHSCGGAVLCEPTAALPGSSEKLAVLEQRARLRQWLWHSLDARRST